MTQKSKIDIRVAVLFFMGLLAPYFILVAETRVYLVETLMAIICVQKIFFDRKWLANTPRALRGAFVIWILGVLISSLWNSISFSNLIPGLLTPVLFFGALFFLRELVITHTFDHFLNGYLLGAIIFCFTPQGESLIGETLWKFGLGVPVYLLILTRTRGEKYFFAPLLSLSAVTLISVQQGFRTLAALAGTSIFLLILSRLVKSRQIPMRFLIVATLTSLAFLVQFQSFLLDSGKFGSELQVKSLLQGNAIGGGLVGSRINVVVTLEQTLQSPIFGHGSNAGLDQVVLAQSRFTQFSEARIALYSETFRPHSALIGTWYMFGILGLISWLLLLKQIIPKAKSGYIGSSWYLASLYLLLFDSLIMSPFAAGGRLQMAMFFALIFQQLGFAQSTNSGNDLPVLRIYKGHT